MAYQQDSAESVYIAHHKKIQQSARSVPLGLLLRWSRSKSSNYYVSTFLASDSLNSRTQLIITTDEWRYLFVSDRLHDRRSCHRKARPPDDAALPTSCYLRICTNFACRYGIFNIAPKGSFSHYSYIGQKMVVTIRRLDCNLLSCKNFLSFVVHLCRVPNEEMLQLHRITS